MKIEKPLTQNQKYYANKLYALFLKNRILTKEQMFECLGWEKSKDRQLRDTISIIAQKFPIISTSDTKGYMLARDEDIEFVKHQILENRSRMNEIQKRNTPLENFLMEHGENI